MKRIAGLVGLLASFSLANVIEIDLPVSEDGWDHHSATFIGVNLKSYLGENQNIQSAVLQFTGIQNLMEPENNDILHINLLKSNYSGLEQQMTRVYTDDQEQSNFFRRNANHLSEFQWLSSERSDLGSYSDNNDVGASVYYEWKEAHWETNPEHDREKIKGYKEGYHWRWENGHWENAGVTYRNGYQQWHDAGILWSKYSGWTTEDFDRVLDVNLIKDLMALSDGWIGFGLDADCHYMGNVKLVVTTEVPEPGSLSLMFLGLTSLTGALLARRRKN